MCRLERASKLVLLGKNLMRCKTYPGAEMKEGVGGLRDSYSVKSFASEGTGDKSSG